MGQLCEMLGFTFIDSLFIISAASVPQLTMITTVSPFGGVVVVGSLVVEAAILLMPL